MTGFELQSLITMTKILEMSWLAVKQSTRDLDFSLWQNKFYFQFALYHYQDHSKETENKKNYVFLNTHICVV